MQPPTKDKGGYLRLESRRWTFITKQIEGTYPNWRTITDDVREFTGTIEVSDQAAEAIARIVPRLPGDDTPNHTVGLYSVSGRLYLRGFNKDQERATEVEVPGVTISGDPATVYVNRAVPAQGHRLWAAPDRRAGTAQAPALQRWRQPPDDRHARACRCQHLHVQHQGPGIHAGQPHHPGRGVHRRRSRINPKPLNPNHNQPEERNHAPMQNATTNHQRQRASRPLPPPPAPPPEEKTSLEQALDQIEFIKGSLRGAVTNLNNLADTLRQVQRERRLSEREVRSVRDTLKTLQTVRL